MIYICDAPGGRTWFRLENEIEAEAESEQMRHAVAKHFRRNQEDARQRYQPTSTVSFEQQIGLKSHLMREMALFLTLRNQDGEALVTAMLPPGGQPSPRFRSIIVGPANEDPYERHADAIGALAAHFALNLDRHECYPYQR